MSPMKGLTHFIKFCTGRKDFMRCAGLARPIMASEGAVRVEVDVTEEMTNNQGILHGGCTFTLIDIFTTAACMTTERKVHPVSVDFHVSYLSPAKQGDTVVVDARVVRIGGKLAYVKADVLVKDTDTLVACGSQTMAYTS